VAELALTVVVRPASVPLIDSENPDTDRTVVEAVNVPLPPTCALTTTGNGVPLMYPPGRSNSKNALSVLVDELAVSAASTRLVPAVLETPKAPPVAVPVTPTPVSVFAFVSGIARVRGGLAMPPLVTSWPLTVIPPETTAVPPLATVKPLMTVRLLKDGFVMSPLLGSHMVLAVVMGIS
jgi:hypothetical protein